MWDTPEDMDYNIISEYDINNGQDYQLSTIQLDCYFKMYQAKTIYSIHYFLNEFVIP